MKSSQSRSVLPVLYVGCSLTAEDCELLRTRHIGVLIADDAERGRRMLRHFQVAAIVLAKPNVAGLRELVDTGMPVIVIAAHDAACNVDGVTIVRGQPDVEEVAAVVHGVVQRNDAAMAARDAA